MTINNEAQAKRWATSQLNYTNPSSLIVSANGDIYANCNIDAICAILDAKKVKYFILAGQQKPKKKKSEEN